MNKYKKAEINRSINRSKMIQYLIKWFEEEKQWLTDHELTYEQFIYTIFVSRNKTLAEILSYGDKCCSIDVRTLIDYNNWQYAKITRLDLNDPSFFSKLKEILGSL